MLRPRPMARLLAAAIVCLFAVNWLESPLRPPATRRLQMLVLAPQFWGYFSEPLQDRTEVYRLRDGTWVKADFPLSSPKNLLGLGRGPLLHSSELRSLMSEAPLRWAEARAPESEVPEVASPPVPVRNLARRPQLCGEMLLLERSPVPWAWAGSRRTVSMPLRYARLDVQC